MIVLAVRWYLRYGLSYRDLEELLGSARVEAELALLMEEGHPLLVDDQQGLLDLGIPAAPKAGRS